MWIWLLACAKDEVSGDSEPTPIEVVDTATYLARCEQVLGPMPVIDCQAATEIPITVDGVAVAHSEQLESGGRCDKPSVAGCGWGSRLGVAVNEQGTPWVFTCRNYDDDPAFDQLNAIAVHPETGETCFLSTNHRDNEFGLGQDLPRPGSDEDLAWFPDRPHWYTLENLGRASCVVCHDNGPILVNPWIAQPGLLPELDHNRFEVIAQDALVALNPDEWVLPQPVTHPDAQACTQCHAISAGRSCTLALEATGRRTGLRGSATAAGYPQSRWMPHLEQEALLAAYPTEADWEAAYGLAADTLEGCCGDSPDAACFE
ncbi:MAG: hypothetical protein VX899_13405 [Myxococcota bacterium]|nr:hypothetical protein [Myxococcota bacterium]